MPGLEKEFAIFAQAVVAGAAVYGAYTVIRIIRRLIKHRLYVISIEDFLFWTGTSFYLFIKIYETSDGSVRWFFVLGVAAGMINVSLALFLAKKMWRKVKKTVDKSK